MNTKNEPNSFQLLQNNTNGYDNGIKIDPRISQTRYLCFMFVEYKNLSAASRCWIFQAHRMLLAGEVQTIEEILTAFCEGWNTHGELLTPYFEIRENRFVILVVDETRLSASGCSIDSATRVMKELQQRFNINFFDRTQVALQINGNVVTYSLKEAKEALANGTLAAQTILYNTLVATKGELETAWLVPIEKSWLSKWLPPHLK
ncbi:MAG: ABC transporter ATPase [Bacteroidetes bacterium]|nr:ABC transporter ATPase [Bacteroidota bacterium]